MVKDRKQALKAAKSVLLIDWPDQSIPRSLVKAGLTVYGFSPGGFSRADIADDDPGKTESTTVFLPPGGEEEYLIFQKIAESPGHVDIICIYRPEAEHERIFEDHILPLGVKTIWLQPPVATSVISQLAAEYGIKFIEGINIAEAAAKI